MEHLLFAGLIVMSLAGVLLAAFQLPGAWLILAAAIAYDWQSGWEALGWPWLVGMGVLAGLAELVDTLAGAIAAKRAGASRRAIFGSLIGGFAGMFLLSPSIPIIGTIIGGLLGCFLGALIGELSLQSRLTDSARVGLFATIGKTLGLVAKTSAAMVIAGMAVSIAALALRAP